MLKYQWIQSQSESVCILQRLLTGWDTAAGVMKAESQRGSMHYCAHNVKTQLALLLLQDFNMTEKTLNVLRGKTLRL